MPTPRIGRVQGQGFSNLQVSTSAPEGAFGGISQQAGQAAQGALNTGFEIAQKEKQKADDTATQEAFAKTVSLRNKLFWDPKDGAMAKKGKDAFGVSETYGQEFDKGTDEISETLSNPVQKDMYAKLKQREKMELEGQLEKHTFQESQSYSQEVLASGVAVSRDDAVLNYTSPDIIQKSLQDQRALIETHAAQNGWSEDRLTAELNNSSSKTQSAIIGRMLANGQDLAAKKYFEGIKDQIHGEDVKGVEASIRESTIRGESQRQATTIMSQAGGSERQALTAARKIEDPTIQEAVVREVKVRFAENESIKRNYEENNYKSATNYVEQNKQLPTGATWNAMNLSQRSALTSYLENIRKGVNPERNSQDYYDLMNMASVQDTASDFMRTDLLTYKANIDQSQLSELIKVQADMRKGLKSSDLDGYRGRAQIVSQGLASVGIDPTPSEKNKQNAERVYKFNNLLDQKIDAYIQENGKKPPNKEIQSMVDSMIEEAVVEGSGMFGFFQNKKPAFTFEDGERMKYDPVALKKISPETRRQIEADLRAKKKTVSDQNVLEVYRKYMNRTNRGTSGS